ncbi:MAG: hypothetical protein LBK41_04190 [Clostridiales bacterium]|nr:hypothetical protein [Clostridiales bacterium]
MKISDLDARKQTLAKGIAELATDGVSPDRMLRIPELPDDWGEAGMDGKRAAGEKRDRGPCRSRGFPGSDGRETRQTQWGNFMPLCWGGGYVK